ncbi:MAG: ParB/RepB/Spo0J family partition protein [Chloroflexi bacterium]|nr:ParB/RepB/Spo0J family partition protein [Chloroflexota bacterium]
MRPRKGLGKGLGALIPTIDDDAAAVQGVAEVPLASITPNPHQPRSAIRDQDLVELAASIQEHGIIQPLIVARAPDGYQLIAGERRWRSARLAGLTTVPVIVKDAAPSEMLELALVENVQRADLNALEEAMAYRQLTEEFGLTQEQVARRVGKSRVAVSNTMRLLKAARPVQEALLAGRISEGHARALLGLEREEAQEAALKTVLKQGLNVRQTEELVRRLLGQGSEKQRVAPAISPETRALESRFREALGTKVNLRRSGGGGRIVIHFYSDEELDALYERIVEGK